MLALFGTGGDMDAPALVAAVLAHGDVDYRALDRFPYDLAFGFVAHGGTSARDAWRRVLASGQVAIPAPAPVIGPPTYAAPSVTVAYP